MVSQLYIPEEQGAYTMVPMALISWALHDS